jgi:hypothetical protein
MTIYDSFNFSKYPFVQPTKSCVFVSYHHENDQWDYDKFTELFSTNYDIVTDTSVDRKIKSYDSEYQMRRIREDYITGSSITIVLCGKESYKRKFIDWEICATLNKNHALLGIILPDNPITQNGKHLVSARLYDNIESGYAHWIQWTDSPTELVTAIQWSRSLSKKTSLIVNNRDTMKRNQS